MKKTIFLAAMISVFSITATFAQDATPTKEKVKKEKKEKKNTPAPTNNGERRGPGGPGMMGGGDLYKDLNLTKEQEAKIKEIDEAQRAKFQELRGDNSLSDEARREKMMAMRKDRTDKMNAILTKEQQEKLDAKMKQMRERGPRPQGGGPRQ